MLLSTPRDAQNALFKGCNIFVAMVTMDCSRQKAILTNKNLPKKCKMEISQSQVRLNDTT